MCRRHEAKLKRCSHEGCTNIVVLPSKEEYALDMGLKRNVAVEEDATIELGENESAQGMGLRENNAAEKDVQI